MRKLLNTLALHRISYFLNNNYGVRDLATWFLTFRCSDGIEIFHSQCFVKTMLSRCTVLCDRNLPTNIEDTNHIR